MRIIAGFLKGKKILMPKDNKTRPLKDLTKESIFNIINHSNKFDANLNDSNVLDLFSGIGSFGIECLSRGVKHVTFIENYKGILPILKKNLDNLESVKNYKIVEKNILDNFNTMSFNKQFDIIFIDPPYKETELDKILFIILNEKILKREGIIIIHRHKKQKDIFPETIKILEEKKYGISKILFCTYS